jgi:hypothetical protein
MGIDVPGISFEDPSGFYQDYWNKNQDDFYDYGDWEMPTYKGSMSPKYNLKGAPRLDLPKFDAPTFDAAKNEPGYAFRSQAGQDALQRSAAAKGMLRTGGTLKDLMEYGQNFASQEYSNVFNRAMQSYSLGNERLKDMFAPQMQEWQMQSQAEIQRALAAFQREWQLYGAEMDWDALREKYNFEANNEPPPEWNT